MRPGGPTLALAIVVAAAGCGPTSVSSRRDTAGLPSTRQDIEEHEWVLDRGRSSLTVDDPNPVTLAVRDDAVSGAAPCNAYRGTFELDDDTVAITDVALTRRACEPATMRAEDELVAALAAVDHVDVDVEDGDAVRMVLEGDDGDDRGVRLAFRAFDADEEIAGTWEVVGVAAGDAVASPVSGSRPTVAFDDGGTVTLDTGCRIARSSWELDGDALTVDPPGLDDDGDCPDPDLATQEDDLMAALASVDRIEITPTELILVTADDTIALVAVRDTGGTRPRSAPLEAP